MQLSCGTVIKWNNKILLCHPTGSNHFGTYSPPKGLTEENEEMVDCAIRETFEETGIILKKEQFKFLPHQIKYQKGVKWYKTVYLFLIEINNLSEIGLNSPSGDGEIIPQSQLQLAEVDWVGFLSKDEIKEKIFWRFKNYVLSLLQ